MNLSHDTAAVAENSSWLTNYHFAGVVVVVAKKTPYKFAVPFLADFENRNMYLYKKIINRNQVSFKMSPDFLWICNLFLYTSLPWIVM